MEDPRPEERIAAAFNALFERFEIRIGAKDVAIGAHARSSIADG